MKRGEYEKCILYKYELANDIGDGRGRYGLIVHYSLVE